MSALNTLAVPNTSIKFLVEKYLCALSTVHLKRVCQKLFHSSALRWKERVHIYFGIRKTQ